MTPILGDLVPQVRTLTADELGIGVIATVQQGARGSSSPDTPELTAHHPTVQLAARLAHEFGGVIFTGPPGTSKTYIAAETARILTDGDASRQWFVQFHASYQYEDFMIGVVPISNGFANRPGPFLEACTEASRHREQTFVIVIDELSRADVGRVFGEALTYVERSKRELEFTISAGEKIRVPENLVILATMNPFDRGVDEVDAAFERRFAKISMDPDRDVLSEILADNDVDDDLAKNILSWFSRINGRARENPAASVGHAYFTSVRDESSLRDLWDFQLKYLVRRAFRLDSATQDEIESAWARIFSVQSTESPAAGQSE